MNRFHLVFQAWLVVVMVSFALVGFAYALRALIAARHRKSLRIPYDAINEHRVTPSIPYIPRDLK